MVNLMSKNYLASFKAAMTLAMTFCVGTAVAAPYPLIEAASKGNLEQVKALISKGADPNHMDDSGKSALHIAAEEGQKDVLAYLLDHKANINLQDKKFQETALTEAAQFGRLEVVKLLLDRGAAVDLKGKFGGTALSAVVNNVGVASRKTSEAQVYEIIRLLLAHGANPNSQQNSGETMLHMPAYANEVKIVSVLVQGKVNPTLKTSTGETALDYCCRGKGDVEMFDVLTKAGYKPALGMQRCLDGAVEQSKIKLVKRLLETTKPDPKLLGAAASGKGADAEEISLLILAKTNDVNVPSLMNLTPLQAAAVTNKTRLTAALLKRGAKMEPQTTWFTNGNALHLAARHGNSDVVKLLLDAGAKVDELNSSGETPLQLAVEGPIDYQPSDGPPPDWSLTPNYMKIIQMLLVRGAKKDHRDKNKKSISDTLNGVTNASFKSQAKALLR